MDFTPGEVSSELLTSSTSAPVARASTIFAAESPPARIAFLPAACTTDTRDQSDRSPVPPHELPLHAVDENAVRRRRARVAAVVQ